MGIKRIAIGFLLISALAFPAAAEERAAPEDSTVARGRFLLVPGRDPLAGFDATEMVWHSSQELLTAGGDALFNRAKLGRFFLGRSFHTLLTLYLCEAMNYYSHEIAHHYLDHNDRRFWLNMSDWSRGWPRFIDRGLDSWDPDEWEYYLIHPNDPDIKLWMLRKTEAGFYRTRLNSRYTARLAGRAGSTMLVDGMAFYNNATYQFEYIWRYGDEPITYTPLDAVSVHVHDNDVTGYIEYMSRFGIEISTDTWETAALLSAVFSGQFWNTFHCGYRYIVRGDRAANNIEFGLGGRTAVAPPNYYLFPTSRGLYLETETYIRGMFDANDLVFVSFGSGLDRFGVSKTGPVDRIRLGAKYHPAGRAYVFDIAPFLYVDFTNGMKQMGHSVGAVVETNTYRRLFLTATLEHNRADMIEQTIKFKDNGFYAIAGIRFRF